MGYLSYIYPGYFVCLCVCVCVCVSQFVSERSAILLVLQSNWLWRRDGRFEEGGIKDGEIGKRQIVEGGCEETFHCLIQTKEKCRFTVPPGVALLNYINCGMLWRIFYQTGIFAGFSLRIFTVIYIAGRISAAVMAGDIIYLGCRVAHLGWGVAQ